MGTKIDDTGKPLALTAGHAQPTDHDKRRYLSWSMDFDARAVLLGTEIEEHWEESTKELWKANKKRIREGLCVEFGERALDQKVQNFLDIGAKPMSIVAYHNKFFSQARNAFVVGSYYPSLTSACALGERILNHLVLDLREDFRHTLEYKKVYRKASFDDWNVAINVLRDWGVLLPDVVEEFQNLLSLRHRSIHFNQNTYTDLREDALSAIHHMRRIIERRFGTHGLRPWFIEGTRGHQFIKQCYENDPFIKRYFIPQCPYVGPLFAIAFDANHRASFYDFTDYGGVGWSDEEFKDQYNNRDPASLARTPEADQH